jgi:hypothetical protein
MEVGSGQFGLALSQPPFSGLLKPQFDAVVLIPVK